jgi:hypothetical protein
MRIFLLTAASFATLATAAPAFAHGGQGGYGAGPNFGGVDPRCASERRTSRNVGGFLGALGGASAGRALAAAAVRPEGVILGTVVGAVVGSSLGNAAVDCSPRALYTQNGGRSFGNYQQGPAGYSQGPVYQPPVQPVFHPAPAPVYQGPVYQAPVQQAPVYQPPVYQQPVYQQPVYQQPVYQQPVYQAPVQQAPQYVSNGDWYQPSPQSYYGQERRGPLVAAPAPYARPDYVPQDSYIGQAQAQTVVVTQTYQAGGYTTGGVIVAPPGAPCGYQICR